MIEEFLILFEKFDGFFEISLLANGQRRVSFVVARKNVDICIFNQKVEHFKRVTLFGAKVQNVVTC